MVGRREQGSAACLAAAALLFGAGQAAAGDHRLSAAQLRALFPGTFEVRVDDKISFQVRGEADGGLAAAGFGKFDQGRWHIKGNRLCVTWKVWWSGKTKCRYIERNGAGYRAVKKNGKSRVTFRR